MIRKILAVFTVYCLLSITDARLTSSVTAAPNPSPLPTTAAAPAPSPTPDTTGASDIREAVRQEVQKRLNQPPPLSDKSGVVGTIISIQATGNLISISTTRQGDKIASISAQTKIIRSDPKGSRLVKIDTAAVGDNIIAIGTFDGTDQKTVVAKRVILFTSSAPKRFVFLGNITETASNSLTVSPAKTDQKINIFLDKTTKVIRIKDGKTETIKQSDLTTGDRVISAGIQETGKEPQALLVTKLPKT